MDKISGTKKGMTKLQMTKLKLKENYKYFYELGFKDCSIGNGGEYFEKHFTGFKLIKIKRSDVIAKSGNEERKSKELAADVLAMQQYLKIGYPANQKDVDLANRIQQVVENAKEGAKNHKLGNNSVKVKAEKVNILKIQPKVTLYTPLFGNVPIHYKIKYALIDLGFDCNSTVSDLGKVNKKQFLELKGVGLASWGRLKRIAYSCGVGMK
jgi:hypothetical protein